MTQAFGHATIVGYGHQSVFGTGVVPSAFLEALQESMQLTQSAVRQGTLARAGMLRYTKSKRMVGGAISHYMPYQGAELLLLHATGGTPQSAQIGSTGVYTHTFVLGEKLPEAGLSVFVGRDGVAAGVGDAMRYDSCQVGDLTLTQDLEGRMVLALELEGREETLVNTAAPTYPTAPEVDWTELTTLSVDGGSPITVNASLAEFKISNPLADDRFKLGSRLRKGLGRGGQREVTGKLALEFDSLAEYNLFRALTECSIEAEWTGAIAAGSTPYKFRISIPRAVFSGTTPNATEAGPISFEMPFDCFIGDGDADEITIELDNLLTSVTQALPGAPLNGSATQASSTQIDLAWTDGAGTDDVYIWMSLTPNVNETTEIDSVAAAAEAYSATGLTTATDYYFWLQSENEVGRSAKAGPFTATTA